MIARGPRAEVVGVLERSGYRVQVLSPYKLIYSESGLKGYRSVDFTTLQSAIDYARARRFESSVIEDSKGRVYWTMSR